MPCIVCFLEDSFQDNLRNVSQQRAEKFEDVIHEYKVNFITEFNNLDKISNCPKHQNHNSTAIAWANNLKKTLNKIEDITPYLDELHDIYLTWINGGIKDASNKLSKITDSHNLLRQVRKLDDIYRIFFKGRHSYTNLSTEENYHIPFNKRYLISNQRYSLTGQPMIYLGLSILDVFTELKIPTTDFYDVNFSSFILKPGAALNIFDFTSDFESIITSLSDSPLSVKFIELDPQDFKSVKRVFYKFILISLCSFKRRKESEKTSFCEEYVLPQLLTEIAKKKNFDGILFYSTRLNSKDAYTTEKYFVSRHKENLALFTRYDGTSNYDMPLISKFEISKPIKFQDTQKIDSEELERLRKQIMEMNSKSNTLTSFSLILEYTDFATKVNFANLMVRNFTDTSYILYKDHPIGQMHYYLLYQVLITVRNKLI